MKNKKYWIVILLALGLIQGCASLGPAYKDVSSIPEDKALVYIYRPSWLQGAALSYYVYVNDKIITKLYSGGYYPYIAEPGKIKFWTRPENQSWAEVNLKAGKTYYLKGLIVPGIVGGQPYINIVSNPIGQDEIRDCKLIPEQDWKKLEKEEEY